MHIFISQNISHSLDENTEGLKKLFSLRLFLLAQKGIFR